MPTPMTALSSGRSRSDAVHVGQGSHSVSADPELMMSTVLGSCIATCLHDKALQIGGMNHFVLPPGPSGRLQESVGVHLMEVLVNDLMKQGCRRQDLVAKLFGGANVLVQGSTVGERNIAFAQSFLSTEGISCVAESVGGVRARLVRFWPASGRAQQMLLAPTDGRLDELRTPAQQGTPEDDLDELWD